MKYTTKKICIPTGERKLKLLILSPKNKSTDRTGVLWIHGGGYVTGMAGMVHMSRAKNLVQKFGAVVVSPEYRLAGQAPYPAALEDCHAALVYLKEHAAEFGVRSDQIIVGGESAGGGLAAALCMYEKDTDGVSVAFQMPLYPMIDCEDKPQKTTMRPSGTQNAIITAGKSTLPGFRARFRATLPRQGEKTIPGFRRHIPSFPTPSRSMRRQSPI